MMELWGESRLSGESLKLLRYCRVCECVCVCGGGGGRMVCEKKKGEVHVHVISKCKHTF